LDFSKTCAKQGTEFGSVRTKHGLEEVAIADPRSQPVQFRSSRRLFGPQTQPDQQVVDILTIDEYVGTSAIRKVDFIKVDVDDYEYKVIKGAL
jgi:FkbM family methyltransferase